MSFVNKKVNLFLILSVAIVIILVAWLSTFYQATFSNVTTEYSDTSQELDICSADLVNYRSQLAIALQTINSSSEDLEKYDYLYENRTKELEETADTLGETQDKLDSTKKQLSNYKTLYTSAKEQVDDLKLENELLQDDIDDLKKIYKNLNITVDDLEEELSVCEDDLDECETDLAAC